MAQRAKGAKHGLWNACPSTRLDPYRAVDTGRSGPSPATLAPTGKCDQNYSGCVPRVAYDLDRADIDGPVRVVGVDIHRFDGDGDGWGCE